MKLILVVVSALLICSVYCSALDRVMAVRALITPMKLRSTANLILDKNTGLTIPAHILIGKSKLNNDMYKTLSTKILLAYLTIGTYGEYSLPEESDTNAFAVNFYRTGLGPINVDRNLILSKIRSYLESIKKKMEPHEYEALVATFTSLKYYIKSHINYRDLIVVSHSKTTNSLYVKHMTNEERKELDDIPLADSDIMKTNCNSVKISAKTIVNLKAPAGSNICTLMMFIAKDRLHTLIPNK
jgi:hypothetical protein